MEIYYEPIPYNGNFFINYITPPHSAMSAIVSNSGSLITANSANNLLLNGLNINRTEVNTQLTLNNEYNIFVDGDLFIDYSVFSKNRDSLIGTNISISGGSYYYIFIQSRGGNV